MSRSISRSQGWSLFPSASTCELSPEMNVHSSSGRRVPYNLQNAFTGSQSTTTVESKAHREVSNDRPSYRRPFHRHRRASLDKPDFLATRKEFLGEIKTSELPLDSVPAPARVPVPAAHIPIAPPQTSIPAGDVLHLIQSPPQRTSSRPEHHEEPCDVNKDSSSAVQSPTRGPCSLSTASLSGSRSGSREDNDSLRSYQTNATSLPALQQKALDENEQLEPLNEEDLDPGSFDLVAPAEEGLKQYSLETRSEQLFSTEHLRIIFSVPELLLRFTGFMSSHRASSVPVLIYYLDTIKALKAIHYSNAIAESLEPIKGFDFTAKTSGPTINADLEEKAKQAFDVMVREDLPAYITHTYIQTVSLSIQRRITGTLPAQLREASEGLAEVFCLTDPSRPDNPIVFASEEFHKTTQYGMSYVIGRNCRFLQGPKTNPFSVRRFREKIDEGKDHCEVFLNYRRDGSPFMNLLMTAPLRDSRGTIRYFIGAQVDVSGLVKECSDMESLNRLVASERTESQKDDRKEDQKEEFSLPRTNPSLVRDEFIELSEMFNMQELDTVRKWGGRMHRESAEEMQDTNFKSGNWSKPRLLISSSSPDGTKENELLSRTNGKLSGIYENYLLVRPYPSLRILFASPSLRVPGILQSPFMAKVGGSQRVRDELTQALADGRGVTAKIRWVASKNDSEGRNRWIHCTPLLGNNGAIGVWMIIIADDEASMASNRRYKVAPPVDPKFGRAVPFGEPSDSASLRDFAIANGGRQSASRGREGGSAKSNDGTERSSSPYSLRM